MRRCFQQLLVLCLSPRCLAICYQGSCACCAFMSCHTWTTSCTSLQERPEAVLPTMGGQTALNLAKALAEVGPLQSLACTTPGGKTFCSRVLSCACFLSRFLISCRHTAATCAVCHCDIAAAACCDRVSWIAPSLSCQQQMSADPSGSNLCSPAFWTSTGVS